MVLYVVFATSRSIGANTAVFQVKADKYSALEIFGSECAGDQLQKPAYTIIQTSWNACAAHRVAAGHDKFQPDSAGSVTFAVSSLRASSTNTTYAPAAFKVFAFTANGGRQYIPTYTAIIHATGGVPDLIEFDEGCYFCGSLSPTCVPSGSAVDATHPAPSYQNNCCMPEPQCAAVNGTNTCDLKIFVVWTGTDASGLFFTSAGERFSRYASFSLQLQNMWSAVTSVSSDAASRLVN